MWIWFSHLPAISAHFFPKNQRSQGTNYIWKTNEHRQLHTIKQTRQETPLNHFEMLLSCVHRQKVSIQQCRNLATEELINSHPYSYKSRGFPRVKTHGSENHIDPWWLVEAMEAFRYCNLRKLDLRCRWLIGLQNLWKPQDFTGKMFIMLQSVYWNKRLLEFVRCPVVFFESRHNSLKKPTILIKSNQPKKSQVNIPWLGVRGAHIQ